MRFILASAVSMVIAGFAGCSGTPDEPPILEIGEVRYWFEGDLIILNVTITNVSNFTVPPQYSLVPYGGAGISEYPAKPTPGTRPGTDLEGGERVRKSGAGVDFDVGSGEPKKPRYYNEAARKRFGLPEYAAEKVDFAFEPGASIQLEMGILPFYQFHGSDGYYSMNGGATAWDPEGGGHDSDTRSGCFNHDVPEFFGVKNDGPDCNFFNHKGDPTDVGFYRDGPENADPPRMLHDPPESVPGAH
jgi:hypothetical protein